VTVKTVANGISFAIQAALLLVIGAWADYGTFRPNITIFFTILAVAVSFAWLGVDDPAQWRSGVALYILGREHSNFSANENYLKIASNHLSGEYIS
jgi:MFS-type transporter involved in bile tolerance (Atg22 family)